ncbi:RnfH family protein [Ottowia testudinis]|uniref:UPF0125 protein J1M35_10880 n=1 Tax=Ottowia testudinis TaxID=2816950 RepID=A0A975CF42_9BURK|nr:RnfH family protein [Ottowia testudinis]QTD43672.1 RnfH family protein [Ottowia testudinis]
MSATIDVTVAYSAAPREVREKSLTLPPGSTVRDALVAADLLETAMALGAAGAVGVWGRKAPLDRPLAAHDRVEVWRPLRVDPKLARRERFGQQGARAAGLFAKRRPGAKPGY